MKEKFIPFGRLHEIESEFLVTGDCITYRDADHLSTCAEEMLSDDMRRLLEQLWLRQSPQPD